MRKSSKPREITAICVGNAVTLSVMVKLAICRDGILKISLSLCQSEGACVSAARDSIMLAITLF